MTASQTGWQPLQGHKQEVLNTYTQVSYIMDVIYAWAVHTHDVYFLLKQQKKIVVY